MTVTEEACKRKSCPPPTPERAIWTRTHHTPERVGVGVGVVAVRRRHEPPGHEHKQLRYQPNKLIYRKVSSPQQTDRKREKKREKGKKDHKQWIGGLAERFVFQVRVPAPSLCGLLRGLLCVGSSCHFTHASSRLCDVLSPWCSGILLLPPFFSF